MQIKRDAAPDAASIKPVSYTHLDVYKRQLLACLTIVGPFLGKKMLVPLTNVSALAFIFSCTMVSFACLRMRTTEPDLPRPYKVPGGRLGIGAACLAGSIIIALMVIPISPAALKPVEWLIVAGWLIVGLILKMFSQKK